MGFAGTETKDNIQKAKDADMAAYDDAFPKGYPAADKVYRKLVKTLYDVVKARDASNAILQANKTKADADLAAARDEAANNAAAEAKKTAEATARAMRQESNWPARSGRSANRTRRCRPPRRPR